jgi:hypothetical protein
LCEPGETTPHSASGARHFARSQRRQIGHRLHSTQPEVLVNDIKNSHPISPNKLAQEIIFLTSIRFESLPRHWLPSPSLP